MKNLPAPPTIFDNTMRTTFLNCPRKFYWWYIREIDYLIRPTYFTWGSAWHLIKGTWYLAHAEAELEPYSPAWDAAAEHALSTGLHFWDNSGAVDDKKGNTRAGLISLWSAYHTTYPSEPWTMVKGGSELGWRWPLPQSPYILAGSFDGYITWPEYGMMPLEEKTTSIWLSDFYTMQWRFSSQVTGYIWYLTNLLGSESVYGAVVNMASKRVSKAGSTPQFTRIIESRSEIEFLEFEADWRWTIELLYRCYEQAHFPKTTDTANCVGGVGKSPCLYRGFCLSGLDPDQLDPLAFPNTALRTEKWEPWKRDSIDSNIESIKHEHQPTLL